MNPDTDTLKKNAEPVVLEQTQALEPPPRPEKMKFLGIPLPVPLSRIGYKLQDFGTRWRQGAIEKAPRLVVNYSPNIMGLIQIAAETFMFSSSGIDLVNKENRGKPLHYLIDPPKNILDTVFKKGGLGTHPLQKEFYTQMPQRLAALPGKLLKLPEKIIAIPSHAIKLPETIAGGIGRLNDAAAATLRDRTNAAGEIQKLTNKWSARSSFSGLFVWSIIAMLPDKKDTQEETEKNTALARRNPVAYVGMRVYQGINPFQWIKHKRQLGGLGMMCAGTFSFISGFRQVAGTEIGHQMYMRNGWQALGGAITTLGGSILLLAIDNDSGYRNFGMTQLLRTFTLPNSIATRFKGIKPDLRQAEMLGIEVEHKIREQGAAQYLTGSLLLNGKNVFAASLAGAEKREDGTVVDHQAMREKAKKKVKHETAHSKRGKAVFQNDKATATELGTAPKQSEPMSESVTAIIAREGPRKNPTQEKNPDKDALLVDAPAIPNNSITQAGSLERAMPDRVAPEMVTAGS